MATLRKDKRAALVAVDAQVGVTGDAWKVARVIDNALAVGRARAEPVRFASPRSREICYPSPTS